MCGIAGVLSHVPGNIEKGVIERMTDCLSHRGPDAGGFYADQDIIALGHRRLSIIDLSEMGNQPLIDYSGRYALVFNGEIYNYKEIKAGITDYPFKSDSDSEVLLASFSKWGIDCVKLLRGMFAFAIWDKLEKTLFLVRDRMGVKPLYYYQNNSYFLFASEVRSLLKSGLTPKKASRNSIYEFLSYQSIGEPDSLIEGVHQVPPGMYFKLSGSSLTKHIYWDMAAVQPSFDYSSRLAVQRQTYDLLVQSVSRRMVSDVPVGAFLSGGIDSSAIVALMSVISAERPNTFTASFDEEKYDESPYANQIARKFNTRHTEVKLMPSVFLDELLPAMKAMDSPSGDGINTYVISKAIKQSGIKVALSGLGGDELFAGYPTFSMWARLKKMESVWPLTLPFRKIFAMLLSDNSSGKQDRIKLLLNQRAINIESVYPVLRQVISRKQLERLLNNVPYHSAGFENELASKASAIHKLPLSGQMSVAELTGFTRNTLLKDTDQMSMAVSLEIREPFFDHDLIEFLLWTPDEMKNQSYPKSLLVESLKGLVPPEIATRKKQGFLFPWELWLKKELQSFGEKYIRQISEREFVNRQALLDLWNRFQKGDRRVGWASLWLFITLEYWLTENQVDVA